MTIRPNRLFPLVFVALFASNAIAQNSSNFQLIGHDSLFNRGMNSAAALYKNFIYIGNRTDGSNRCGFGDPRRTDPNFGLDTCPHVHPGILILDVKDPANPTFVGEIPAPLNTSGLPKGVTSREVRVWPNRKLLITMNFRCSSLFTLASLPMTRPLRSTSSSSASKTQSTLS